MDKRVILITAIGGDIGSSVVRHLKEQCVEDRLIGCDITPYNQGFDYVDEFIKAPPYHEATIYLEFIRNVCKQYEITHLWPITEPEIALLDERKDYFINNDIKLIIQPTALLNIALDKYKTAQFIKEIGLNVPDTWILKEDSSKEFPLIVKGRNSCGSKNIKIVKNENELNFALEEIQNPVIQSYIGTDENEYTMAVFSDDEKTQVISFKRKLGYGGMSIYVEFVNIPELNEIGYKIANSLKLRGSINIQLRMQNKIFYIIEINPRISSTIGFRYKLGFQDDIWWLYLMDGIQSPDFQNLEMSVVGIKTLDEKIIKYGGGINSY